MVARIWRLGMALVAVLAVSGAIAAAAQAAEFVAGSYPAKVSGSQVEGAVVFESAAAELECGKSNFEGQLTAASPSLTLTAQTSECSTGGGLVVMVPSMNGCTYRFTPGKELEADKWATALSIVCEAGKEIVWRNAAETCVVRTPAQEIPATMSFKDTTGTTPKSVLLRTDATGIRYTIVKTSGCAHLAALGEHTDGEYHGNVTFTATNTETTKPTDLLVN